MKINKMKRQKHNRSGNPHDKVVRNVYTDPEFVIDIFRLALTKRQFELLDWNHLTHENNALGTKLADLIFSVPFKHNPLQNVKLFLLFEHKSYYHPEVFTQLLEYQVLVHKQQLKKNRTPGIEHTHCTLSRQ